MRLSNILALAILSVTAAHADLTIEYKTTMQLAPGIPPAMADAMKQQMAVSMRPKSTLWIQGDRITSNFGKLTSVIDYGKGQITLLQHANKQYATIPLADLAEQILKILPPEAREAAKSVQVDVKVARSGKSAVVATIPVEESVVSMEMQGPSPSGPAVQMRMELHNWMASAEALTKFPELKQWDAKKWAASGFNPAELMSGAFAQGPTADKIREAMQGLLKDTTGLSIKTESRIFMPFMAQMMQAQGVQLGDGPLVSTVTELERFSVDPVPASIFEIPADYKPVPAADLFQELNPMKPVAPRPEH